MWTSLLDPRFSLKSWHWRDEEEKSKAKQFLMDNVQKIIVLEPSASSTEGNEENSGGDEGSEEDENAINLFETIIDTPSSIISAKETAKAVAQ